MHYGMKDVVSVGWPYLPASKMSALFYKKGWILARHELIMVTSWPAKASASLFFFPSPPFPSPFPFLRLCTGWPFSDALLSLNYFAAPFRLMLWV